MQAVGSIGSGRPSPPRVWPRCYTASQQHARPRLTEFRLIEEGPILKPRQAADTPVSASRLRPRQHAWREMQREQLCGEGRVEVFREARLLSNRFRRRVAIRVAQTIGSSVPPPDGPRSARALWPPLAHALHQRQPRRRLARFDHRHARRVFDCCPVMCHPHATQHHREVRSDLSVGRAVLPDRSSWLWIQEVLEHR